MKQEPNKNKKDNTSTGASAIAAAAVGAFGIAALDAEAAEPVPSQTVHTPAGEGANASGGPIDNGGEDIAVLGYETIDTPDGGQMDVAVVAAEGEVAIFGDVDQNGIADIMAIDIDHNGMIDDGEVFDVTQENIAMDIFQDQVPGMGEDVYGSDPNYNLASNEPDYINDADVNDYLA